MNTSTGSDWAPGERRFAVGLSAIMLGAVLYPLRQHLVAKKNRKDGFPLSYYPMFSAKRGETCKVAYGVGVKADGTRVYLPGPVMGTGGLNQIRRQLRRVVREERVPIYAEVVAARVSTHLGLEDVVRVEIVDGEFNIDECFLNHRIEGVEEVLGSADVIRLPEAAPVVPGTEMVGQPL
jgi:hypothetical protein